MESLQRRKGGALRWGKTHILKVKTNRAAASKTSTVKAKESNCLHRQGNGWAEVRPGCE